MRRSLWLAGLAAAAFVPALAQAPLAGAQTPDIDHSRCLQERHDNRIVGTVVGAGVGALLGNAIGQHGGREGGTIIGGVGGAVAGNVIGGASVNCGSNQYGYYDDSGRWVPNTATAYGYYDANGRWIDTAANYQAYAPGAQPTDPSYYAPPPPHDEQAYGAPPPPPAYEDRAPPPAYGQQGYDQQGYGQRGYDQGPALDSREREARMEQRIQHKIANGELDEHRGRYALRQLADIRRMDADYRGYDGHLNDEQRRDIDMRLDGLRASLPGDRAAMYGPGAN